jgi:hypothetical protein
LVRLAAFAASHRGAHDNIIAPAGYLREVHDAYPAASSRPTIASASGEFCCEPLEIGERALVKPGVWPADAPRPSRSHLPLRVARTA